MLHKCHIWATDLGTRGFLPNWATVLPQNSSAVGSVPHGIPFYSAPLPNAGLFLCGLAFPGSRGRVPSRAPPAAVFSSSVGTQPRSGGAFSSHWNHSPALRIVLLRKTGILPRISNLSPALACPEGGALWSPVWASLQRLEIPM